MIRAPRRAFLLAAGHGTRLRPLTDATPKCLLPVRGIPILRIWLERCRRFGIEEILINLHSKAELVRQFVKRESLAGPRPGGTGDRAIHPRTAGLPPGGALADDSNCLAV